MKTKPILYFCGHTASYTANTGIQRTTRFLAKALQDLGEKLVPIGFNDSNQELYILDDSELKYLSKFNGPYIDKWEKINSIESYLKSGEFILIPELLQAYDGFAKKVYNKMGDIKKYIIFYDAIPIILNSIYDYKWHDSHMSYMNEIMESDGIISISNYSEEGYKKIIKNNNINIKTIPLPNQFIVDDKKIPEKNNKTKNIEILTVSTVEGRKNHKLLIRAFLMARRELEPLGYNLNLNLVGATSPIWKEHSDFVLYAQQTGHIKWHRIVDDETLFKLYEEADFTIYPSLYEGFGLPIVESLHFNTPCISSNSSSMIEIAKNGGCVLFDPNNQEDLKEQIIYLAKNKEIRHELVNEIKKIPRYSWEDYANNILTYIRNGK